MGPNAASVLPAGFVISTSLFRAGLGGRFRWWSWPLAPTDDAFSWGFAILFLALGVAATLRPGRRRD